MVSFEFDSARFLHDPGHRLKVALIGVGGTGSQVAAILARMHVALSALGHPGFEVTVFDFDTVSESNIGRQLFSPTEIGLNKAFATVSKINRFFGLEWKSVPYAYGQTVSEYQSHNGNANIVISCVDTVSARKKIHSRVCSERAKNNRSSDTLYYDNYPLIWLDFGNGKTFGQAILNYQEGLLMTKSFFDQFPEIETEQESNEPSCSLAAALNNQDLLINSTLANLGMNLLWKIFREKTVRYYGVILNLETLNSRPLKLKKKKINESDNSQETH